MPQFSPLFAVLIFLYIWFIYLVVFVSLWWNGKRFYDF